MGIPRWLRCRSSQARCAAVGRNVTDGRDAMAKGGVLCHSKHIRRRSPRIRRGTQCTPLEMSLGIDSRYITGIYALGQWFKVKKDSIDVDAFQFTNWEESSPHSGNTWEVVHTDYEMGSLYPEPDSPKAGSYGEHSRGRWQKPSGHQGITFIDASTGEQVSFSLMEVRAFREKRPE